MRWNQTYLLFGHGQFFSFLVASLPVLTLLYLLGGLKKPAWLAGTAGLAVTLLLAIFGYGMPVKPAISAAAMGAAFGLFPITWIIFWAIVLFRITVETGQFEIIKNSIGRLTADRRLQALLIAFAFGGFLEGAAGFGTPVAIASTMLIGLGFTPFHASAICLLANTAPVAFGSIGIPIITLAGTTGLPLNKLSAAVGALCAPMSFLIPAYILVAMGGLGSLSGIWIPTIAASAVFATVQFTVSTFLGPQLTDILASITSMAVLVTLLRLPAWRSAAVQSESAPAGAAWLRTESEQSAAESKSGVLPAHGIGAVLYAWMPYALLVVCVLLWGWAPFRGILEKATVAIEWPMLHDIVQRMPPITEANSPYHALFNLNGLSAPGTACMVACLLSAVCLKVRPLQFLQILRRVTWQLALPTVTVGSVLGLAFLMNYCGATATLGLAFTATGKTFPFFSAVLGWIGVFLTGSDTSSNALFGNLQAVTAGHLGFSPVLMAATNSAGGVMGKMISLQTIAVAAAATGLSPTEQSKLFRFTLRHSVLLVALVGCISLIYTFLVRLPL